MPKTLFEIDGFDELNRKLKRLPDKVKRREVLKVLGQVANPTVKAARSHAPISKKPHLQSGSRTRKIIQPGNLKKSIGKIRGKRGLAKINAVLYVGPKARGKYDGWYGAFVHGGTVKQSANPFMQKAYNQTRGMVTADAEKRVAKYIQKQINRLSNV